MTMYPMPMPEMPQEVIDMIGANPEGFAEAMGSGMEAMTAAMEGGASPAEAFEAMGDTMGPIMEDLGMSPEVFDAMGDMVGAAVGPAMHMAPADADGGDMGAMMQDGMDMMMPPGTEVPGPIMDAMGDMGAAMGEAGMGCHDVATEFMAPPGDPMYPMPVDGAGNPVVEPGQPETCPADACQAPPMDGACATAAPSMMPPEGGYDHAPMNDDFVMPEPFVMATPDPTGELSGAENIAPDPMGGPAITTPEDFGNPAGDDPMQANLDDGGREALEDSIGADHAGIAVTQDGPNQDDVAVGAAMDGATEQGGGVGSGASVGQDFGNNGEGEEGNDSQDVDPSAGMG